MRRVELLVIAALAGCMRIYPDPELPDVAIHWPSETCWPGTGDVTLSLVALDESAREELTVPCAGQAATFEDVARTKYYVAAVLHDTTGAVYSSVGEEGYFEVDLRNGISERVELFFPPKPNFRVAWTFADGASCESLGARYVTLRSSLAPYVEFAPCELPPLEVNLPEGLQTITVLAIGDGTPVARSASLDVEITSAVTDLGIVTLEPCSGEACF